MGFFVGSAPSSIATWHQARRVTRLRTDVNPAGLGEALYAIRRVLQQRAGQKR